MGIGSRAGGFRPVDKPFKFSVTNGEINYIGSFVGDQDLNKKFQSLELKGVPVDDAIYSKAVYAVRPDEPIMFYVIDERDDVINKFHRQYPDLQNREITFNFMK